MKAVIFDCDGVLINTEELGARALKETFNRHGLNYTDDERLEKFSGASVEKLRETVSKDYQKAHGRPLPDSFFEELNRRYQQAMKSQIAAIDGVVELLQTLRTAGIPFAIASNGDHIKMEAKLRATGLYNLVNPNIFSKDDVANPKPAPDVYLYAAQQLGIAIEDCVVVEDSQIGVIAAAASGAYVLGHADAALGSKNLEDSLKKAGADETYSSMVAVKNKIYDLFALSGPTSGQKPDFPQP